MQLEAGATVVFPEGDIAIPVSPGDSLGNAGHLAANQFAIHFEIFATQNIDAKHFQGTPSTRPEHSTTRWSNTG